MYPRAVTLAAVAAVLFLIAGLGVIWALFMAADHRRLDREREQLERKHREVMERADRALRHVHNDRSGVAQAPQDRDAIN